MDMTSDKRERILAAAQRLVVRNGLQCSMAAIADEAGVATGSLYNYFDSKEALVRGLYERVALQMSEALMVPADPDPGQTLRNYFSRYVHFIGEDEERAKLFSYLDNTPLISSNAVWIFGPFVTHGVQLIVQAQAAGMVRPGSAKLMMSFLRGAVRNALKRRDGYGAFSEEDRQLFAQMCWDAIKV
ncbi:MULTISPECIES: TetR/AcrR family transcriptional regulator [unclassified Agrobacterium]|uniref:TetR/AcrR family transcriptional regulator n=1 Tax=unclassified Agrobacterium TaxID=2632611 RepID=UPI002447816E|nr:MULTISPECIES: TetR/AcrR family transcriptional regulator [unclassified Agrobacterium]MDH0613674.1 TetR/AcrR family transcriptional regulator [Agrobacterium sp. GD03872]MDH0696563.1 TetR/AcrR family transcriptional regulator [Agrobacterium sp. GD03871]MDH1059875.1 TetR/AcrR family transcriptional regulator [Agrobacterium sp. GD03992]MDH2210188.1 TetR/AcrR family transcriptional regulator [Agrobacterium sp. GD03643]MDH2219687.1 TetR/AcrR family transcriptional regulator [Agrobacterium sp. GD0